MGLALVADTYNPLRVSLGWRWDIRAVPNRFPLSIYVVATLAAFYSYEDAQRCAYAHQ